MLDFYCQTMCFLDIVYITTRVPDTSNTIVARVTPVRHEQHECDVSET